ncbi:MAG: phenylalanine--tRNA ligase subunit beta [Candidatus Thorarchaeota archaeon]
MGEKEILCEVIEMIVGCLITALQKLIGKKISIDKLEDTLFLMKAEIEKVEGDEVEIEINPDRQDMLSAEGIARAVKAFLGIEPGLREFPVKKSGKQVIVKKGLSKIRPFISCGIVKGVQISDDLLKDYMHLQEALTSTHGRNRKKASIGLYVYDDIEFPVYYQVEKPKSIRFAPLGHEEVLDGPAIIAQHEKGELYGPIISENPKWPLLIDAKGEVLSLPPIINSNTLGKLTTETTNIFVEVTGTHLPTVDQALNIMITALAERGGTIESLTTIYPDESTTETPDLKPEKWKITTEMVNNMTGFGLKDQEVVSCLHRMGYGAKATGKGKIGVEVPRYRTDVLHDVDIIEDVAIGYGFDNIEPTMPQTMTSGKLLPLTRLRNKVRDTLVGVGFQEVLSYVMTSPDILNTKMLRNKDLVTTSNPKSRDYSVLRNSLLPILIDFVAQNQHADYPQRLFEVGYIVTPNEEMETSTHQIASVSGVMVDNQVNITDLIAGVGFLLRNLGIDEKFDFIATKDRSFIEGRTAKIRVNGKTVGVIGEISPEVLTNFGIGRPIVAFELHLPKDAIW